MTRIGDILRENHPASNARQLVVVGIKGAVVIARDPFGREFPISDYLIHKDDRPRAFGYSLLRRDDHAERAA